MTDSAPARIDRRALLGGAAAAGVSAPLLAACGGGGGEAGPATAASGDLVATADVPVGGGVVVQDAKVVVTQPTEGDFKGFSAVCTHQGCVVQSVEEGKILCTCHDSQFSIEDGSVLGGPATAPLPESRITVEGGQVTAAT